MQYQPTFIRALALVVCASAAVAVVRSAAQQSPARPDQDQPRPTFRTEANYVRVDVIPTSNGQPVADLRQDEFEVLENGVPQRIEQFEHITIRAAGPQDTRIEPNTVAQSRQMLADTRARVFVVFLDVYHVEVGGSHNIRGPLVKALDQMIGPDDLVGIMTPEMSAGDITFARKTTTIDGFLTRHWNWGEREQLNRKDPEDDAYYLCYPGNGPTRACSDDDRGVAAEMIARRHEKRTLDAMEDLVRYLRGIREERKAIIAISDGWLLFRPNQNLSRRLYCQAPGMPDGFVDPRTGKPTLNNQVGSVPAGRYACDRDRMALAAIDDDLQFRTLLDEANRSNASFYPIDPRGLPVFDTPMVPVNGASFGSPAATVPPSVDNAMLQGRITSLRTLAEATDGLAIVNSNDLNAGMRRVVDDLTSYYLLGYYSSGKLDGRFHSITVRVKRPGVQVRARRGYLAATEREVAAARDREAATAAATRPEAVAARATSEAAANAVAQLAGFERPLPFRLSAVAGWAARDGQPPQPRVWAVAELTRDAGLQQPVDVDFALIAEDGRQVAGAHSAVPPISGVRVPLSASELLAPGDYTVRARPAGLSAATVHVLIPASPEHGGAVYVRRGPLTGNREVPTADLRFRRSDQVRIERAAPAAEPDTARLLDRAGKAIPVPVTTAVRDDAEGVRWHTAQVALAPLAPGDYMIELSEGGDGNSRALYPFRVVP